uniref:LEM domain-containing protein n=1 Tax=Rhabditophanes sp. KR3021 TaxID=114890 RepID=A0AC35TL14_9BILA
MDYENLTTEGVSRLSDNKLRDTWNDLGIAPASLTPTSRPFMEKKILSVIREKNSLPQKTFKRVGIVGEAVAVHEESPFADSSEATVMNDVHQNGEVIELFEYVPNTPIGTKHHNRSDDTPFPEKNVISDANFVHYFL